MPWWEPLAAYWSRKRLERLHYQAAARLLESLPDPCRVAEDPDADRWRLLHSTNSKNRSTEEQEHWRDTVRRLVDANPFARNALSLYRNYVVGTGMRHEVMPAAAISSDDPRIEQVAHRRADAAPLLNDHTQGADAPRSATDAPRSATGVPRSAPDAARLESVLHRATQLWTHFLLTNQWESGQRKDWEFCVRTWRDGECFLRLFRQPSWPPRIHFVDPERIAPDPINGQPIDGIATANHNVEELVGYLVHHDENTSELVPADRILHCKIGVDANVPRGLSIFVPALDALQKYQSWLDIELIHRKVASSIVLVRKHAGQSPGSIASFADWSAQQSLAPCQPLKVPGLGRHGMLQPGTIIDAQGYDLQYLSPDAHFADASILGRRLLLAVAAALGLPEFMLSADAANANYSSTLVAEGPAVRHFAAWQAFFVGQWQALFRMVMTEAARLGLLPDNILELVTLLISPPALAVRNRKQEAEADAIYFDRGALSRRELSRRDQTDPDVMQREREEESPLVPSPPNLFSSP